MPKKNEADIISIPINEFTMGQIEVAIIGVSPFVCNRVAEKAMQQLLYPSRKKNAAEKNTTFKHNPMSEYRSSPYTTSREDAPTVIEMPAVSFKRAMESVALDVPGTTKSQLSRNLVAIDQRVPLFGVPQLFMSVVRSADQAKTPDIRTRAIIPQWATTVRIRFPEPLFVEKTVVHLLGLAGLFRGVGDYRPEKGAGSYGQFEICAPDDPRYLDIVHNGGRAAQLQALHNPSFFDDQTETLFAWFEEERGRRGTTVPVTPPAVRGPVVPKRKNGRLEVAHDAE